VGNSRYVQHILFLQSYLIIRIDMSIEQHQSLLNTQGPATNYEMADSESMGLDDAFMHPPIGAEGAEHSHAGNQRGDV
jgi:hypothetical protein